MTLPRLENDKPLMKSSSSKLWVGMETERGANGASKGVGVDDVECNRDVKGAFDQKVATVLGDFAVCEGCSFLVVAWLSGENRGREQPRSRGCGGNGADAGGSPTRSTSSKLSLRIMDDTERKLKVLASVRGLDDFGGGRATECKVSRGSIVIDGRGEPGYRRVGEYGAATSTAPLDDV